MVIRRRKRAQQAERAIAVVRCSTSKQDLSPHAQSAAIDAWCAREGVQLVACYFDLGVSGEADLDKRPGLMAGLAALQEHRATVLVAAKVDRIGRDAYVVGAVDRVAAKAGARVVSVDGEHDDALTRGVKVLMSNHELRMIQARTTAALQVKRARGERTGNVPYGKRLAADGMHTTARDGRPACRTGCTGCLHLEAEPTEQGIMARAKALSDEGMTVRAIAAALNDEGYRNRAGNPFAFQSVHAFLSPMLRAEGGE